jgi:diguanylate cyclase (GGDEF)-like protein
MSHFRGQVLLSYCCGEAGVVSVNQLQKIARQLFVPGGALLLALMIALRLGLSAWISVQALEVGFVVIGFAVVVLAWRFQLPRIALAAVILGLASYGSAWAARLQAANQACLLALLAVVVPVNLALLLLVDESNFDLESFGWWSGLVGVESVIVSLMTASTAEVVRNWLSSPLFGVSGFASAMLRPVFLAATGAAIALGISCVRSRKSSDMGLLWAAVATSLALASSMESRAAYFGAAMLLLGLGVLETAYSVAFNDELTGLPGRRAYNRMIASLDGEYTIAVVDIDHFKKFNDTYGHDIGDQVLRMVASRLADVTGGGKAFRCGGEEFAVIFPYLMAEEAYDHAELLRQEIESTAFTVRGPDRSQRKRKERRAGFAPHRVQPRAINAPVTVSIGLAEPNARATVEEVAKWADKALYEAKGQGRNRVVCYSVRKRPRRGPAVVVDAPTPSTPFR